MRKAWLFLILPLSACQALTLTAVPGAVPPGAKPVSPAELSTAPVPTNASQSLSYSKAAGSSVMVAQTTAQRTAAWPDKVAFRGTVLSVTLNDGRQCEGDTQGLMRGTLANCPWPLKYELENVRPRPFDGPANVVATAHPYTQVVLTAPNGFSWRFQTPIVAFGKR
ncbi:hypothetical protein [Thioclava sp. JE_KL1]|uniref:hypothetical protein n=1 Tax=Thioclava sp. JE_KL1 TaxID=2651187 RepID=UPI00128B4316|nr:hypothetical protein [Thioclava sp. JE_KL1]MPQ96174.1 hypothetical protein [Thioclava sp. JE_KL1]